MEREGERQKEIQAHGQRQIEQAERDRERERGSETKGLKQRVRMEALSTKLVKFRLRDKVRDDCDFEVEIVPKRERPRERA